MKAFTDFINTLNGFMWGPVMLALLVGTGIFLSFRSGFIQFRKFGLIMKETVGKLFSKTEVKEGSLSQVQAMTTALAGTVGTGNIAGVTGAIALGGPGAVFWMWISALFGMCTKFTEVTLSVRFRQKNDKGDWVGGPMYYIKNGLGKKWKWLGTLFALFAMIAAFGIGNMTQVNTIATSVGTIFTAFNPAMQASLPKIYLIIGIIIAILTALVLFGGLQRIGATTEKLVPVMAIVYIVTALVVIFTHVTVLGSVFHDIFVGAFNPRALGGGLAGTVIMQAMKAGIGRGVFSNEAGLGSAPIAHAAADTDHPIRQGFFGAFEVFADTIVICTMTALAVLASGKAVGFYGKTAGTDLTIQAFSTTFGSKLSAIIIATCIAMFAFSTVLSWALYGTRCAEFLFKSTKVIKPYQIVFILFIVVGATMELDLAWTVADTLNAMMAIPNLIAILALSPEVIRLMKDFFSDRPKLTTENLQSWAQEEGGIENVHTKEKLS